MPATRYRDLVQPTLLQTGLVDHSGADTAQRLASTFKQFERQAVQVGTELRQQQGSAEGAAAGAAGQPNLRSGWKALTAYGQAYNSAAEVTYSNKLQLDVDAELDRIELESEADPILYASKAKGLVDGTLKDVPPKMRPQIEQMITSRLNAGTTRIAAQAEAKRRQEGVASYVESAPGRIAGAIATLKDLSPEEGDAEMGRLIADNQAQLQALVADNALDPVKAVQLQQAFIAEVDDGLMGTRISDVVDDLTRLARSDTEAADAALAGVEDREDLSTDDKEKIRSMYRESRNLLYYERARQYVDETTNLARRLEAEEYGEGVLREARRLYKLGALSPEGYESAVLKSDRNAEEAAKVDGDIAAVEAAFAAGRKLYPGNPDHVNGLNKIFESRVEQAGMEVGDDRWRATALAAVQQTNILPEQAETWAGTQLLSENPETAVQAAQFMSQVREASPAAFAWNKEPKLEVFAEMLNDNIAAGVEPTKAYELVHNSVYPKKDGVRNIRAEEYDDIVKRDKNISSLNSLVNEGRGLFSLGRLKTGTAVQAEYESMVRQYYIDSGDIETARTLAGQNIKRTWGETQVNGEKELTKFPIEKTGIPVDIVRKDLANTMKAVGATVDPEKVRLVPIGATDRTRGLQWGLEYIDEVGGTDVVLDDKNRPLAYSLPYDTEFKNISEQIRLDKLAKAKAERDRVLNLKSIEKEIRASEGL